jgi:hypothetical protein
VNELNDLDIMGLLPFLIPIILLQIGLMVWALIDISKRKYVKGNKVVWILVIVLVNIIGPIIYFLAGRGEEEPAGDTSYKV